MTTGATRLRIGIDLGGTKIEGVAITLGEQPHVLARRRIPTDRTRGYDHILACTESLVRDLARDASLGPELDVPIGVGMPGATTLRREDGGVASEPLVKNSNTVCLNGRPFHGDLRRALKRPVAFINDANAFALAEATWGAARGSTLTFGIILGTGVGGGIVWRDTEKRLTAWEGAQHIAGEWGHTALAPECGPSCYCGRRGCVETYLSGPAIEGAFQAKTGTFVAATELFDMADRGKARPTGPTPNERAADEVTTQFIELFGRATSNIVNILDPDTIVVGGGLSHVDQIYTRGMKALASWTFSDSLETRLVKNQLGDSAGVFGAALAASPHISMQ